MNVKAALLLCTGVITMVPCVIQRVETPPVPTYATIAAGQMPPELRLAWGTAGLTESSPGDWRAQRARRLARPNLLEAQASATRVQSGVVALLPPVAPPPDIAPLSLPPLAYDIAAAAPAGPVILDLGTQPIPDRVVPVESAAATEPVGPKVYHIAKGDTLAKIAEREWGSHDPRLIRMLIELNPRVRGRETRLVIGEELAIPDAAFAQKVLAGEPLAPVVALFANATPADAPLAAPSSPAGGRAGTRSGGAHAAGLAAAGDKTADRQWYTIRSNDSLASIAQRYLKDGARWREIVRLNGKLDPQRIVPGTRIKLPPLVHASKR